MSDERSKPRSSAQRVRCFTRALKNARYIQLVAPDIFKKDRTQEGFGTGIPLEVLRVLHRTRPDSPLLGRYPDVANFLKTHRVPPPDRNVRGPLFSGTIHFAQVTFITNSGNRVVPTADMNTMVQYAQRAIVPIQEYASQYGQNSVTVSSTLITDTVKVPSGSFGDSDLTTWVNKIASDNRLPSNDCLFIVFPPGLTGTGTNTSAIGDNSGFHDRANVAYVAVGVFHTGLTVQDVADVYAMVVSHEMAEMVIDPNVDHSNPEVCDPCDVNCNNLTRIYLDGSDSFLGANQNSPPSGFNFAYYICAVVKPSGASSCPAPSADCQYSPPPLAPPAVGEPFGYFATVPRVIYRANDGHIHEFSINQATEQWQQFDMNAATGAPAPAGDPRGYLGGVARVVYRGQDSHIHEIALGGPGWQPFDLGAATGAPPAVGEPFGYFATVPRVIYRANDGHIHEFSINQATGQWQQFDMNAAS